MDLDHRGKMFAGALIAIVATIGLAAVVSTAFPSNPGSTMTGTTTVQAAPGKLSDCGFLTSCTAIDTNGLAVSMSINTTAVRSNGSFTFILTLSNPTPHAINVSKADSWYMSSLNASWPCNNGLFPYGYAVFRGYYTLSNASLGQNVLHPAITLGCVSMPPKDSYSIPPKSTYVPSVLFNSSQIYAIDGGFVKQGNFEVGVNSLWSSLPGVYTIVAGDEWGNFVLLHFSVV